MVAALGRLAGVRKVAVNAARTEVEVQRAGVAGPDADLVAAVRALGYRAEVVPARLVHLRVQDLSCGGCPRRAREALRAARGTRRAEVDARAGRATVAYDRRRTDPRRLIQALEAAGFRARLAP